MNPDDLKIWTMFACAALSGITSLPADVGASYEEDVHIAATCADDMMAEFIKRREGI